MRSIFWAVVAVAAMTATPGMAVEYKCTVKVKRSLSWIPTQIWITHDEASGKVTVRDVISQHFLKKPVQGRVLEVAPKRTTFGWDIPEGKNKKGETLLPVNYRAAVENGGGEITVYAKPEGATKHYWSPGTCKAA